MFLLEERRDQKKCDTSSFLGAKMDARTKSAKNMIL